MRRRRIIVRLQEKRKTFNTIDGVWHIIHVLFPFSGGFLCRELRFFVVNVVKMRYRMTLIIYGRMISLIRKYNKFYKKKIKTEQL